MALQRPQKAFRVPTDAVRGLTGLQNSSRGWVEVVVEVAVPSPQAPHAWCHRAFAPLIPPPGLPLKCGQLAEAAGWPKTS